MEDNQINKINFEKVDLDTGSNLTKPTDYHLLNLLPKKFFKEKFEEKDFNTLPKELSKEKIEKKDFNRVEKMTFDLTLFSKLSKSEEEVPIAANTSNQQLNDVNLISKKIDEIEIEMYLKEAKNLYQDGDFSSTLKLCNSVLKYGPCEAATQLKVDALIGKVNDYLIKVNFYSVYAKKIELYVKALDCCEEIFLIYPHHKNTIDLKREVIKGGGRVLQIKKGIIFWNNICNVDTNRSYNGLGEYYSQKNKPKKSIRYFDKIIKNKSKKYMQTAILNKIYILMETGKFDDVIRFSETL